MPYFDRPHVAVSTGIPDWLSVVNRKIRARERRAVLFLDHDDAVMRDVAKGIIRHIRDDRWFHGTQAFVETNMQLAVQLRDLLPGDEGFRPTFVGHIVIEMFLDAFWIQDSEATGRRYYDQVKSVSAKQIQTCVNQITEKPTQDLAPTIERFIRARFLYDYLDHDKLLYRLNQVMSRVGLAALPDRITDWLESTSRLIRSRRERLLTPPGEQSPFPFPSSSNNK